MLDKLAGCLGSMTDPAKSQDHQRMMDVLGIEPDLSWEARLVRLRVTTVQALKWVAVPERILEEGALVPEEAANMAGILSFAVGSTFLLCR